MSSDAPVPALPASSTDRRALLAGIGGLAAGTFLSVGRAEAGSLTPPGAPSPTGKPLAEVEPRVAVNDENTPGHSNARFIITRSGSYYLADNVGVDSNSVGVQVEASNVTLDLNGFSIIGKDSTASAAGVAVASGCANVAILSGFIAEVRTGVVAEEADSRVIVRNVHVRNTQFEAILLPAHSLVEDCTTVDAGGVGVSERSRVARCLIHGGGYVGIYSSPNCVIIDNQVSAKAEEGIMMGPGCHVEGNTVRNCGAGMRAYSGGNTIIRNNTVLDNTGVGLRVDAAGNTVSGNTVRGNGANYVFVAGNQLDLLISQIPQVLSWPCSAKLQGTLTALSGQSGITIASDDVTLDLCGHALRGPEAVVDGISVSSQRSRITVRNGSLTGWGGDGVDLTNAFEGLCEDLRVVSCGQWGIVSGMISRVERCRVQACQNGIRAREKATVTDCRVDSCEQGGIELVGNAVAERNDLRDNEGPAIHAVGSGSIVRDNTVVGGFGTGLKASAGGNTFSGNVVRGNIVNYDFVAGNQLELLISQIPQTLSWPCSAKLQGTLTGVAGQSGITITSDNVTIDLGGHALIGAGTIGTPGGVFVPDGNRVGIQVRNGSVRGWQGRGVDLRGARGALIEFVQSSRNNGVGIFAGESPIVSNCSASENSDSGFVIGGAGLVANCVASRNLAIGFSTEVLNSRGTQFRGCSAVQNNTGFFLYNARVIECQASSNVESGILVQSGSITNCAASDNGSGISITSGSVTGCLSSGNTLTGIAAMSSLVANNHVYRNGTVADSGTGISVQFGCHVEGNVINGGRIGLRADSFGDGSMIVRNTFGRAASDLSTWSVGIGNYAAPMIQATANVSAISSNSHPGSFSTTDPNANINHQIP